MTNETASLEKLRIDVSALVARQIYALLRHELGCEGPKVEKVALELAKYLDRKPEEMFGMTYQELHNCVVDAQLMKLNRGIL